MFKRIINYYRPYRTVFFLDMFCAAVLAGTQVAYPLLLRYLTRQVFPHFALDSIMPEVWKVSATLLLLYVIQALCQYYVTSAGHIMGARIETDMRRELFAHMEKLSFSYYDRHSSGRLISRILSDLFDITELAHHGPENIVLCFVQIVGAFFFLAFIDWVVTAALLLLTVFMIVYSVLLNREMRRTFMDNRRRVADINSVAQDSLSGIRTVVSFNNEERELQRFEENNQNFLTSKKANYFVMGRYHTTNGFLQGLMTLAVILCGGWRFANGYLAATDIVIYLLYVNMFMDPIKRFIQFTEQFQKGYTGFLRMCEILDTEPEIQDRADALEAGALQGNIHFENVSFAYQPNEAIFQGLELEIPAKRSIALVGPSGVGKSTFCSLIPRFYDVQDGRILVDGRDIRDYSLASLRQNIGIVQQDVYIFNMSIRDNIAYGKPEASDEEIIEAAKRAQIHDFIMSLPEGYETQAGERGVRFSGGQKQRLSIARIFLQNPPILILDEATSSLDNESEVLIQAALDELSKARTSLIIAHRLSTIRHADEILYMDKDGIAERGTHEALMALDGRYKRLYQLQFREE